MGMTAPALWCTGPGTAEIRPGRVGEGVLVEAICSGISRGTERLVFEGQVPESEWDRMRAPAQEGAFPFPVKYGYAAVGRVAEGALAGDAVFALFPHQSRFRLPEDALQPLPPALPPERAVLGANMETALNVVWDSGASAGDRIAVVGAGVLGSLVGALCARLPGAEVTLVDTNPARAEIARHVGCAFAPPDAAPAACDVVIHTSASAGGLATALAAAGAEARVVEASWHGSGTVRVPLGGAFHSQRLRIVGSQVGRLPPERTPRWSNRRRLAKALELLVDPRFDTLISGETPLARIPDRYGAILAAPDTLCHRIQY